MFSYHVLVLPAVVIFLVVVHVLLVRKHGVVPPFEARQEAAKATPRRTAEPEPRLDRSRDPPASQTARRRPLPRVEGRLPLLRPGQGVFDRPRGGSSDHARADHPVLIPGREVEHDQRVVTLGSGRLRDHRRLANSMAPVGRRPTARPTTTTVHGQHEWFIRPQKWLGVSHPINTARDYVLAPLSSITGQPRLQARVIDRTSRHRQSSRPPGRTPTAVLLVKRRRDRAPRSRFRTATTGPVPTMMSSLLGLAQAGVSMAPF